MKVCAVNKRAGFDYEILETIEAGVSLTGHEAKSIKMGRINISGAHAIIRDGSAFIVGMSVPSFQAGNAPETHEPERTRRLLIGKKDILRLENKILTGLTLVPIKLYNKGNVLKLELGLSKGKKKYDKRETIKKREAKREIQRGLSSRKKNVG